MVYFIQSGDNGPIKIGVSNNPQERLKDLQTAHYQKLQILRVMDGDRRREAKLHKKFNKYRLQKEWFENVPELLNYIYPANKKDTITINLNKYTGLVQELGHYKGMLEGQTRHLLEYKADIEAKDKVIFETKTALSRANSALKELVQYKQDAEQKDKALLDQQTKNERLQAENEKLKLPWYRRWFEK